MFKIVFINDCLLPHDNFNTQESNYINVKNLNSVHSIQPFSYLSQTCSTLHRRTFQIDDFRLFLVRPAIIQNAIAK